MRRCTYADNLREIAARNGKPVKVSQILAVVNEFLADKRDYIVVTESGDMLFGGLDIRVPHNNGVFRAGILRLDGICGAGRARRADRQRTASAGDVR